MTPDEAKAFILAQCLPDSGTSEPQTFLGALRPYRGTLPHARFHDLMSALRVVAPDIASKESIDRELVSALWSLCHLTRMWALVERGMLRRNNLINDEDRATLEEWHDMFSFAVMILLESGDETLAFEEYELYRVRQD